MRNLAPYAAPEEGRAGKLRLDFNENTVGCSPAVLRALRQITPSRSRCIRSMRRPRGGWRGTSACGRQRCCSLTAWMMRCGCSWRHLSSPAARVLVPEPTFSMYRFFSEVAGAKIETVRYDAAMRFPLEETMRALKSSPRILFIANPNNPTGTVVDLAALERILDAAKRTLVFVDEAYFEFCGVTVLPWIRRRPNLVVSRTFSKAAGLAALRLGALFARADLADAMRRAFTPYPVNSVALVAAEAALKDRRFLRRYVSQVRESRWELTRGLAADGRASVSQRRKFRARGFRPGGSRLVAAAGAARNFGARPRLGVWPRRIRAHHRGDAGADATPAEGHRGGVVKFAPKLVVFDVDGVLVDVRGSFHRSIIDTVQHFTGTPRDLCADSAVEDASRVTTTIGG